MSDRNVESVIGLEVHVQLATRTKLFSGCTADFAPDRPNTQTDPLVLGLPGSLPVLNAEAFRMAVKVGLALNCEIARFCKWDRKQYYYPDLPKGYQISQFDLPVCGEGWLEIDAADGPKRIGITRAHLEEDAGKNMHAGGVSKVDLNRAGTPLVEIVSEPDMSSGEEAKAYLERLRLLLTYLGVSDCNMQEGSLRCDVNVNFRIETPAGMVATPIAEVKNLNSFRGVEAAIEFERTRQVEEFDRTGQTIREAPKQTRGWDPDKQITVAQRTKEEASDYRYFPCPDLVPVTLTDEAIEALRGELGEFPADRRVRIGTAWKLSDYDAGVIIERGKSFADYFETVAQTADDGKRAANWCTQDVLRDLSELSHSLETFPIPAAT
ncbi:MAG: Asp-tRNA(Asn)/Glu-tRNA(Gln) amidotransferase subunit GatB, partial [Planctomycetota bacterium]